MISLTEKEWKNFFQGVLVCENDEVLVTLTPDEMGYSTVDAAQVLMAKVKMFYPCLVNNPIDVGIPVTTFLESIDGAKGDIVTTFEDELTWKSNNSFGSVPLIDPTGFAVAKLPDVELSLSTVVSGKDFYHVVRRISKASDAIKLTMKKDSPNLFVSTYDVDNVLEIEIENAVERSLMGCDSFLPMDPTHRYDDDGPEVCSIYAASYLTQIASRLPKNVNLKIDFGHYYPIKISFAVTRCQTEVLLAPRVEMN